MTLNKWLEALKGHFNGRELNFQQVHKVELRLQMKDGETGEILLHDIKYKAKDAQNFEIVPK